MSNTRWCVNIQQQDALRLDSRNDSGENLKIGPVMLRSGMRAIWKTVASRVVYITEHVANRWAISHTQTTHKMSRRHLIIDSQRDRQVHYATGNVRVIPPGVYRRPENSFDFSSMANLHKSINIKTNNISLLPGWWICFAGTLREQEPPEDAKNVWSIVVVFWVVAVVAVVVAAGAVGSKDSRWNLGCVDTPWESQKKTVTISTQDNTREQGLVW